MSLLVLVCKRRSSRCFDCVIVRYGSEEVTGGKFGELFGFRHSFALLFHYHRKCSGNSYL